MQLSSVELMQIKSVVLNKQIFVVVDGSTLSGVQYLNALLVSLETPHVSHNQPLSCA